MDVNDLESAINSAKSPRDDSGDPSEAAPAHAGVPSEEGKAVKEAEAPKMSKEEEIGFHKGALNTLAAERNELAKMIGNVEAIMQAHVGRLKELGVDFK